MDNHDLRKQKSTLLKLYLYVVDSAPASSSAAESCIMLLLCSWLMTEMKAVPTPHPLHSPPNFFSYVNTKMSDLIYTNLFQ